MDGLWCAWCETCLIEEVPGGDKQIWGKLTRHEYSLQSPDRHLHHLKSLLDYTCSHDATLSDSGDECIDCNGTAIDFITQDTTQ